MGFLPWSLAAQLRLVLFGSSRWWPRNSPQARQSLPSAIADRGYSPLVVELNGGRSEGVCSFQKGISTGSLSRLGIQTTF
eukprot:g13436.t2